MHEAPKEQMLQDTNPSGIKTRTMDIRTLKPHPRNQEFFDDIDGEKWEEFKENIKANGLHVPILVTTDGVIVSGHQRVRACMELEMYSVPVNIKYFDSEDAVVILIDFEVPLLHIDVRGTAALGHIDHRIQLLQHDLCVFGSFLAANVVAHVFVGQFAVSLLVGALFDGVLLEGVKRITQMEIISKQKKRGVPMNAA